MTSATSGPDAGAAPPAVAVVVPVYNCERYVREAIESVLAQTLQDFELILVDDGSTDGSPDILAEYEAGDTRVRVLHHETPKGSGAARNAAIAVARAELLAFLDADDLMLLDRLDRQKAWLDAAPDAGALACPYLIVDLQNNEIGVRRIPCTEDDLPARLRRYCHLHHAAAMFRARVLRDIGGYRPGFAAAQDYDLWLRLIDVTRIALLDVPMFRYRQVPTGITYGWGKVQRRCADLAREFARQRMERGDDDYEKCSRTGRMPTPPATTGPPDPAGYRYKLARTALDCGAYGVMLKSCWRGFRARPTWAPRFAFVAAAGAVHALLRLLGALDWFERTFRGR